MNKFKQFIQEKIANFRENTTKTLTKNTSNYYYFFFLIVIIIAIFFLTSRMFLEDNSIIKNTSLDQSYSLNSTTKLTLTDWIYNEKKQFMLAKITLEDVNYNYQYDLNFNAVSKVNPSEKLPVKIVYKRLDRYYILIENIPENYGQISLRIHQTFDNKEEENILKIYGDNREMKIDNSVKIKTQEEYHLEEAKLEIEKSKEKQQKLNEENTKYQNQIDRIDNIIQQLLDDKKYKTNEEIRQIDEQIILKEKEKDTIKRKIEDNKNLYLVEEKEIESLTKQLEES